MIKALLNEIDSHGDKGAVVPVSRFEELRREMEALKSDAHHVWSDWTVTKSSHKFTKKDAHTIEFPVQIAKDGETTVTYTIRTSWGKD
jgi:hypothetical protein